MPGGTCNAFGHQFEMMDQRFHADVELGARRRADLAVVGAIESIRQIGHCLAEDAHALAHFLHANDIASVTVAVGGDGHVEIVVLIAAVGHVAAQIPVDAAAAQHRAGETHVDGVLAADDADALQAFFPQRAAGQHVLVVVEHAGQDVDKVLQFGQEGGRQVFPHAADADVAERETCAADHFEQIENAFALARGVHEQAHAGAGDVEHMRRQPHEVGGDALHLAHDDANDLGAFGNLDAEHLLHGEYITEVIGHGRDVVHAVGVVDEVLVALVFAGLLEAAVQIADVGVDIDDFFAFQLYDETQHAVGAGVVRAHVDDHVLPVHAGRHRGRNAFGWQDLLAQRLKLGVFPRQGEGHALAAFGDLLAQRIVGPMLQA